MKEYPHQSGEAEKRFIKELDYITDIHPRVKLGQYENDYLIEDHLEFPLYELSDSTMKIHDVAWGNCELGDQPYDQMLLELARTPLFRRLQSIEQLTLGPAYATMPNSAEFSRWQHIWGSLVFVRKMNVGRSDLSDRERIVMELRTLLSDVGHTVFSHLGDWLFQDSGKEDLHDQDLKALLKSLGIEEILEKYGLTVEETVFPEKEDWIECGSPDLCVDRVDYGMREILRWGVPTVPLNLHKKALSDPQSVFAIDGQNRLVIRDQQLARYFAAGFSLLPTEHWGHPVHRLQLELLQSSIRTALVEKVEHADIHPRDAMYGIDADFDQFFLTWEGMFLNDTMKQIAHSQRQIFVTARRADLDFIMGAENNNGLNIKEPEWKFPKFPDPLEPYTWKSKAYSKPYPQNIDIKVSQNVTTKKMYATDNGLVLELPALKARAIDPLITDGLSSKRLSELEPSYKKYLEGQRTEMAKGYIATVLMRRDVAEKIVNSHVEALEKWPELTSRDRNVAYLKQCVVDVEAFAAAKSFDQVHEA